MKEREELTTAKDKSRLKEEDELTAAKLYIKDLEKTINNITQSTTWQILRKYDSIKKKFNPSE